MATMPEKLRLFWSSSAAWFRQFLIRYKLVPPPPPELPARDPTFLENILTVLNELRGKDSSTYSPLAGSSVMVDAMHVNIIKHVEILKSLNRQLSNGEPVDRNLCYGEFRVNSVDSFFVSEDNRYIDVSYIEEFVAQATIACNFLTAAEGAEVGVHEHNFRVMKSTMNSVRSLARGISDSLAG